METVATVAKGSYDNFQSVKAAANDTAAVSHSTNQHIADCTTSAMLIDFYRPDLYASCSSSLGLGLRMRSFAAIVIARVKCSLESPHFLVFPT